MVAAGKFEEKFRLDQRNRVRFSMYNASMHSVSAPHELFHSFRDIYTSLQSWKEFRVAKLLFCEVLRDDCVKRWTRSILNSFLEERQENA